MKICFENWRKIERKIEANVYGVFGGKTYWNALQVLVWDEVWICVHNKIVEDI